MTSKRKDSSNICLLKNILYAFSFSAYGVLTVLLMKMQIWDNYRPYLFIAFYLLALLYSRQMYSSLKGELNGGCLPLIIIVFGHSTTVELFLTDKSTNNIFDYAGFWILTIMIALILAVPFVIHLKKYISVKMVAIIILLMIAPGGFQAREIFDMTAKFERVENVTVIKKETEDDRHIKTYWLNVETEEKKNKLIQVEKETYDICSEGDTIRAVVERSFWDTELWEIEE